LEELDKVIQQFATATSQFATACQGSSEDIIKGSQKLITVTADLLSSTKGLAKKTPTIAQQLMESGKAAGIATQRLIELATIALKQGNVTNPQNIEKDISTTATRNHQVAATIANLLRAEHQRMIQDLQEGSKRKEGEERMRREAAARDKEKVDLEDRAEKELVNAAKAIAEAAEKLRSALKVETTEPRTIFTALNVDHRSDVIDASSSVAVAIAELLKAAALAQAERTKQARDTRLDNPYHKDPTWTEGLISAARNVVSLIEQLVTATQGELEEEVIVSLARAITAATAQLMSAERAKGDPDSEAHKKLTAAAKVVARTTTELVQKMRDATEHKPEPVQEYKEDDSIASTRSKELEAAIKIAKLEKELERARLDMLQMRQEKYQN